MSALDRFTRAYLECALWSSMDNADEQGGSPLDENYSLDDFSPEALASAVADCADFQSSQADLLADIDSEQAGHDFWLTRNGHGAGFWDRGHPGDIGKRLTDEAKVYGGVDLDIGDDGLIYGG